ncbi:hypothetical protein ACQKWADRAFT_314862, partial [Trichoderma austrokoningii]
MTQEYSECQGIQTAQCFAGCAGRRGPSYLKKAKVTLANQTFEDIKDESTLRAVHSHLFEKYVLIGKVIDARKLHHTHFYSLQVDYGHQAYIDKLSSQRQNILQSLEKLEKRTADLLYRKEHWFAWVRKAQEEEEATREKEQKRVKQEASLFKRYRDQLRARLERARREEEKKSQDAYLEQAYQERMAMSADETDNGEDWDPIKDMELDKRTQYIDLIKHFLWIEVGDVDDHEENASVDPAATATEAAPTKDSQTPAKRAKKRSGGKKGAAKPSNLGVAAAITIAHRGQKKLMAIQEGKEASENADQHVPDKKKIETEHEMRKRLSEGVGKKMDNIWGFQLIGSVENPHETYSRTAPMTDDEIESAVKDIREIKLLLFCRLLLAQASMLPAALRSSSVEDFLNDADIVDSDLRDLCLKLEDPSLQQIRDACADF